MFRAEISDTSILKNSLQSISNIITEGVFQFNEDGVELVAADPAMVAMVDFRMDQEAFDAYECDEPEKVGVNIEDFYSIIRRAGSNDAITLSLNEDESKLTVTMENDSTRNFSLALLNLDASDIPSQDDLEFTVHADLTTEVLDNAIGDAAVVSDQITVGTDGDALTVTADGDNSNIDFTIQQGSNGLLELETDGAASSMFALDYLSKIIKAKKLSDTVSISLADDFPMRLDFEIPEKVQLGFILAPRIEE